MLHHYRRRSSMPHAGAKPVKSEFIVARTLRHVLIVKFLRLPKVVHREER
jgi:hypothetical protein